MNRIQQVRQLGQSIWIDYMRRGMLKSGEFQRLVDTGISGVTANPTIFEKAIAGSTDYDDALKLLIKTGKSTEEMYEALAFDDIRAAADMLRPVFDSSGGGDGFVSLECNPALAYDTEATMKEARHLFAGLDRPNILIKVPATPQGIPAIRRLIGEGINVNITLIFSLEMYRQVREAYIAGLETLVKNGGEPGKIASVASFFLSRVDTMVDAQLEDKIKQGRSDLKALLGKAAVSNAKTAYQSFKETFAGERFKALKRRGARVQRPLWASTSTKNPAYPDLMYVEPLIGADTVNTLPPATIEAFLDHGRVASTMEQGADEARKTLEQFAAAGIDMEKVTARLLEDGVKLFDDSFKKLLASIEEKRKRMSS